MAVTLQVDTIRVHEGGAKLRVDLAFRGRAPVTGIAKGAANPPERPVASAETHWFITDLPAEDETQYTHPMSAEMVTAVTGLFDTAEAAVKAAVRGA